MQTSASYVVNMQHILTVASDSRCMADSTIIPITRAYAAGRRACHNYLLERP
ncbi:hypothetical protein [Eubacterium limosum]|uniref:hypothetical protein n=1 Tax=Eubacterium limosum TaxID=1736 RepID=UPI0037236227